MKRAKTERHTPDVLQQLQDQHPGWKLWPSRDQRLMCATLLDRAVGVVPTLVEDSLTALGRELVRQAECAAARVEL